MHNLYKCMQIPLLAGQAQNGTPWRSLELQLHVGSLLLSQRGRHPAGT